MIEKEVAITAEDKPRGNSNLSAAKKAKNDEFYTQIGDIEDELGRYPEDFWRDKIVYCNCDDCYESNFFKYFYLNFNRYGLKKLITTCYDGSKIAGTQKKVGKAYKLEITNVDDFNGDGRRTTEDLDELFIMGELGGNSLTILDGDGDFRSKECLDILKECDVVVTNPPFSLFREFVATLVEYGKYFTIIGNMNAITYKEIFPLIRDNKMWLGYKHPKDFIKPDGTIQSFGNIMWFTNIPISKRRERLIPDLYKTYSPDEYPTYDNYDAINVDRVAEIPVDYMGVMGVPITFLEKYNPDEFEIVSFRKGEDGKDLVFTRERERIQPYFRILVRRRNSV